MNSKKIFTSIRPALLALACVSAGPAAPATPPPLTRPAAPLTRNSASHKASLAKSLDTRLLQGAEGLTAGDVRAAREAFLDVLEVDPKNVKALLGAGYCYLSLKDNSKGRDYLDRSIVAAQAANVPLYREQVLNAAVCLLRSKNPMRAAKFAREYLAGRPDVDETALNALGVALSQADEATQRNKFFAESVAFYEKSNAQLEATRPGEKRWGVEWLGAADVDFKMKAFKEAVAANNKLSARIARAQQQYNNASDAYKSAVAASRAPGRRGRVDVSGAQFALQRADSELSQAKQDYEEHAVPVNRAPFPSELPVVALDRVDFAPTAIAAVTPAPATPVFPPVSAPPTYTAPPAGVAPPPTPTRTPTTPAPARPAAPPPAVAVAAPPAAPPRPRVTSFAVAFPVTPELLVTALSAVDGASRISVQLPDSDPFDVELEGKDETTGLALLRVKGQRINPLPLADAAAAGPIQATGFPKVELFEPSVDGMTGTAGAPAEGKWTVRLNIHPRLAGGPLLAEGKVVGVELADRDSLASAIPAATVQDIKKLLGSNVPTRAGNSDARAVTMQLTAIREK